MSAAHEKASGRNPEALHNSNNFQTYSTTSRGRRAISSLWNAGRLISGAQLSEDDLALIGEMLTEIASMVGVAHAK
ncbi:hypothetical protein [Acidithiobacillus thiooxidans]|uniref:Uncharacterized protein n=1 Tax=Acidithiobacillus thiooxidans ATCC 19377 TaxID=637390 RepID=A0A543PZD9_ACITH|nr:hypothetical protein [Acidithiobacillus thiooxidans]MDX5936440.1 hypothetical protein [Acidithiobacillus thiooxidans]TQN49455.1 hypothetical protein DLNHIDIE_03310 [Acidithiobacillus thiooxidans ATCC 19377]